jgi:hypothetical protein
MLCAGVKTDDRRTFLRWRNFFDEFEKFFDNRRNPSIIEEIPSIISSFALFEWGQCAVPERSHLIFYQYIHEIHRKTLWACFGSAIFLELLPTAPSRILVFWALPLCCGRVGARGAARKATESKSIWRGYDFGDMGSVLPEHNHD